MKNTKKKLKGQLKVVRYSFTGSNITKYSGLNTVAKYMNKQDIIKSVSTLFPTEWHSATKFGVNPVKFASRNYILSGLIFFLNISYLQAQLKPNIIFIMADDLGYGDLGCYGQEMIQTPHLDKMAAEGIRFTQHYAGSTVCAPSRGALMTGLHTGHGYVKGNFAMESEGNLPLPAETVTVAEVLQSVGYKTGVIGKWGLGGPNDHGQTYENNIFEDITGPVMVLGKGNIRMRNITVRNNIFKTGEKAPAIRLSSAHWNLMIDNNIFYDQEEAIALAGKKKRVFYQSLPSAISVRNNIFAFNNKTIGPDLLLPHKSSRLYIEDNLFYKNNQSLVGENVVEKDPEFRSPEKDDFRPRPAGQEKPTYRYFGPYPPDGSFIPGTDWWNVKTEIGHSFDDNQWKVITCNLKFYYL